MIDLDHNAGAPLRPEARAAMLATLDAGGNASAVHGRGRAAKARLEDAREAVAAACGVVSERVVFTAGGAEADALALHGRAACWRSWASSFSKRRRTRGGFDERTALSDTPQR